MNRVTVIGSGNGGCTAAYHFARNGNEVCLYDFPEFHTQIDAIRESGEIRALEQADGESMILGGAAQIACATTDIAEAMRFADIYVMVCPSFAQEKFFAQMLPYLKDGDTVIAMPANYAGLVFCRMLGESAQPERAIHFVDTISIPWATRLHEPGVLTISGIKKFLPLSIYPEDPSGRTEEIVRELLPIPMELLPNPLIAGLENINFGGHPLMSTVNIGLLENFPGRFNYYRDCCSVSTAKANEKMDRERLAVGEALGWRLRPDVEIMNALYGSSEDSSYAFNRNSVTHTKINAAPTSARARYITEDVPYLLVPFCHLAKLCGVEAPVAGAVVTLASAYNEEDYFATGRSLADMGLAGMTKEEIVERFFIRQGGWYESCKADYKRGCAGRAEHGTRHGDGGKGV